MKEKIYLSSPHMSDEGYEMEYIKEAFETNWIAPLGTNVNEFEKELAYKVGSKAAAALSSGTAAIHLALKAAGVSEGDIVFCQSLTPRMRQVLMRPTRMSWMRGMSIRGSWARVFCHWSRRLVPGLGQETIAPWLHRLVPGTGPSQEAHFRV